MNNDKPHPHNIELEKTLLAALIKESLTCIDEVRAAISVEALYSSIHATILSTIFEMNKKGRGIDLMTLSEELTRAGNIDEVGGMEYLLNIDRSFITTAFVEDWCHQLNDLHARRTLLMNAYNTISDINGSKETDDILSESKRGVEEIEGKLGGSSLVKPIKESLRKSFKNIKDALKNGIDSVGIRTGMKNIDDYILLRPGNIWVIGARPSIGKTALGLSILKSISRQGINVGMISLEMTDDEISTRLMQMDSGISVDKFIRNQNRSKEQLTRLETSSVKMADAGNIFISDIDRGLIGSIRRAAYTLVKMNGCRVICIDYMQIIKLATAKSNRQEEIEIISGELKSLAKSLKIPLIILAQVNRQTELSRPPKLEDLRGSGAIEQDADIVTMLHRASRDDTDALMPIEKNRNGRTGLILLDFNCDITLFTSASRFNQSDRPEARQ
jgi:replicative DNA helicase